MPSALEPTTRCTEGVAVFREGHQLLARRAVIGQQPIEVPIKRLLERMFLLRCERQRGFDVNRRLLEPSAAGERDLGLETTYDESARNVDRDLSGLDLDERLEQPKQREEALRL